jgi:hypothetical protein
VHLVGIKEMIVNFFFILLFSKYTYITPNEIFTLEYIGELTVYCGYRNNTYCWSAVKIYFKKYTNTSALPFETSAGNLDNCPA